MISPLAVDLNPVRSMNIVVVMTPPTLCTELLYTVPVPPVMPVPASVVKVFASNEATPVELMLERVVIAPVEAFSLIDVKPPFERTGPLKVVLAMSFSCLG
jgi:hypothetical protein